MIIFEAQLKTPKKSTTILLWANHGFETYSQQKEARYLDSKHIQHSNIANTSQRINISDKKFLVLR